MLKTYISGIASILLLSLALHRKFENGTHELLIPIAIIMGSYAIILKNLKTSMLTNKNVINTLTYYVIPFIFLNFMIPFLVGFSFDKKPNHDAINPVYIAIVVFIGAILIGLNFRKVMFISAISIPLIYVGLWLGYKCKNKSNIIFKNQEEDKKQIAIQSGFYGGFLIVSLLIIFLVSKLQLMSSSSNPSDHSVESILNLET